MEKQLNSDIEVSANFQGIGSIDDLPDFEFSFYTELNQSATITCSKSGGTLTKCIIKEYPNRGLPLCEVKCILENHNFSAGRLCVMVHIKWTDPDYADGVRNDIYRQKLDLIVKP